MKFWRTTEVAALRTGRAANAIVVARQLNRSPRAVQEKARAIGLQPPQMPHACYWPPETRERAHRLRGEGLSVARISQSTGVPVGTIRHWIYG